MNGQFLPRKNPAKTVKGRGFLDRGLMEFEEAITYALNPSANMLVITECIIPEGSRYYINDGGEVVSNKIIISGFRDFE